MMARTLKGIKDTDFTRLLYALADKRDSYDRPETSREYFDYSQLHNKLDFFRRKAHWDVNKGDVTYSIQSMQTKDEEPIKDQIINIHREFMTSNIGAMEALEQIGILIGEV